VADLVSRKPKPDSHDEGTEVAPKTIALEFKPSPEEEQSSRDETAVDRSAESGSEAHVEATPLEPDADSTETETAAPVAAEAPAAPAGNEEPAALPQTTDALVKRVPTRSKKVEPIAEPVISVVRIDEEVPAVAAGPKSFADEMADLDAEVAALRRQLAKKLIEQNAQLRKMLARFDGR